MPVQCTLCTETSTHWISVGLRLEVINIYWQKLYRSSNWNDYDMQITSCLMIT